MAATERVVSAVLQHCYSVTVCFIAASGHLNDDVQAGLQAIVKNISSGSVKVK